MSEFETFLNTVSSGEQRSLLSYGPAEGSELIRMLEAGLKISAVNLLGKHPIPVVEYLKEGEIVKEKYDLIACFILLATWHAARGGELIKDFMRWLKPGGEIWLTVPVGALGMIFTRQYGNLFIFDRHNLIDFITGSSGLQVELIHESYYRDHEQAECRDLEHDLAVTNHQIRQVALYGFRKISAKKRSKDAVERDHDTVIVPSNMKFIPREEMPAAPVQMKGASSWPHAWV